MSVAVVGAGLGGLAAALRLQGAGHDVVVLERLPRPGGRADRLRDGGYTWDTGPSLIMMPWVLEETFAAAGLDLHWEIELRPLDPFYERAILDAGRRAFASHRELAAFLPTMLLHHTLCVGPGYRAFLGDVTRARRLPRTLSTYVHAPARTEPAMACGIIAADHPASRRQRARLAG